MKKTIFAALVCVVVLAGCTEEERDAYRRKITAAAPAYSELASDTIASAEGPVSALEDATGYGLDEETASRGAQIGRNVGVWGERVSKWSGGASALPGPHSGYAATLAALAGAVSGVGFAVGRFFENRKRRKAERGLRAVLRAVDNRDGIGRDILAATSAAGVADVVETQYRDAH